MRKILVGAKHRTRPTPRWPRLRDPRRADRAALRGARRRRVRGCLPPRLSARRRRTRWHAPARTTAARCAARHQPSAGGGVRATTRRRATRCIRGSRATSAARTGSRRRPQPASQSGGGDWGGSRGHASNSWSPPSECDTTSGRAGAGLPDSTRARAWIRRRASKLLAAVGEGGTVPAAGLDLQEATNRVDRSWRIPSAAASAIALALAAAAAALTHAFAATAASASAAAAISVSAPAPRPRLKPHRRPAAETRS